MCLAIFCSARHPPVISLAAITRVPAYSLMARSGLKSKVKNIADLKGRIIDVEGHTKGGRSTTQMFAEYILMRAGVPLDNVNFIPASQSYPEQRAALASGAVDALMGDEPFVARLNKEGAGYYLADFHDIGTVKKKIFLINSHGQPKISPIPARS